MILLALMLLASSLSPAFMADGLALESGDSASSTSTAECSTINTFNTTVQVHIFTPNASTAVIEAEEVRVSAVVYGPGGPRDARPILLFSGAVIATVFLIILRRRGQPRDGGGAVSLGAKALF
ncbi:MAG: hypothetical protein QW569_05490 [Candidatus Bathyarchaeia archaeon]